MFFSATVTNLQTKVESLTTTNALMKEDLAIAKNSLLSLYNENRELRKELGQEDRLDNLPVGAKLEPAVVDANHVSKMVTGDLLELQQRLEEERKLRQESDKELELQVRVECTYECE